jgi:hypothetical protein
MRAAPFLSRLNFNFIFVSAEEGDGYLHFNLVQKRIVDPKQAAVYVGLKTTKRFEAACPVHPVLGGGVLGYDLRDLDAWIDGLKAGAANDNVSLLARLDQ